MPMTAPGAVSGSTLADFEMPKSVTLMSPDGGDEQVGRFHVAMHDAVRVRVFERVGDLRTDRGHLARRERATRLDDVAQALANDQLHHEVRAVRVFARVVDRHHVRVVEARRRPRLVAEALARPLQRRRRQLHRDPAVEEHVARGEDLAHAADSQQLLEPVAAAEHVSYRGHQANIPTSGGKCLRGPTPRPPRTRQIRLESSEMLGVASQRTQIPP